MFHKGGKTLYRAVQLITAIREGPIAKVREFLVHENVLRQLRPKDQRIIVKAMLFETSHFFQLLVQEKATKPI